MRKMSTDKKTYLVRNRNYIKDCKMQDQFRVMIEEKRQKPSYLKNDEDDCRKVVGCRAWIDVVKVRCICGVWDGMVMAQCMQWEVDDGWVDGAGPLGGVNLVYQNESKVIGKCTVGVVVVRGLSLVGVLIC